MIRNGQVLQTVIINIETWYYLYIRLVGGINDGCARTEEIKGVTVSITYISSDIVYIILDIEKMC